MSKNKDDLLNIIKGNETTLEQMDYLDVSKLHDGSPPYYCGYEMNQVVYTADSSLLTSGLPADNNLPIPFGGNYDFSLVMPAVFVIDKSSDIDNNEFICLYLSPSIFGADTFQFFFHPWVFKDTKINTKSGSTVVSKAEMDVRFYDETSNIFELDTPDAIGKDFFGKIHVHAHDNVYSVKQGQIGIKTSEFTENNYGYCQTHARYGDSRNIVVHAFIMDTTTFVPHDVAKDLSSLNLKQLLDLMVEKEFSTFGNCNLMEKIISLL